MYDLISLHSECIKGIYNYTYVLIYKPNVDLLCLNDNSQILSPIFQISLVVYQITSFLPLIILSYKILNFKTQSQLSYAVIIHILVYMHILKLKV